MNLSRDQMDRAAEIWLLAQKWRRRWRASPTHVIANCDDPLVTWGASTAATVTWVAGGQRWKEDSWCCPRVRRRSLGSRHRATHDWATGPAASAPSAGPSRSWVLDDDAVIDPRGRALAAGPPAPRPGQPGQRRDGAGRGRGVRPRRSIGRCPGCARSPPSPAATPRSSVTAGMLRLLLAKNPAGWLEAFDVLDPGAAGDPVGQRPGPRRPRHLLAVGRRLPRAARQAGASSPASGGWTSRCGSTWPDVPFQLCDSFGAGARRAAAGQGRRDRQLHRLPATSDRSSVVQSDSALRIVWIYPDLLSTYGDQGNVLILEQRAQRRASRSRPSTCARPTRCPSAVTST